MSTMSIEYMSGNTELVYFKEPRTSSQHSTLALEKIRESQGIYAYESQANTVKKFTSRKL